MVLGAFVACFTTGPVSTYFSRRWSILIGVVLLVITVTIMTVSYTHLTLPTICSV